MVFHIRIFNSITSKALLMMNSSSKTTYFYIVQINGDYYE